MHFVGWCDEAGDCEAIVLITAPLYLIFSRILRHFLNLERNLWIWLVNLFASDKWRSYVCFSLFTTSFLVYTQNSTVIIWLHCMQSFSCAASVNPSTPNQGETESVWERMQFTVFNAVLTLRTDPICICYCKCQTTERYSMLCSSELCELCICSNDYMQVEMPEPSFCAGQTQVQWSREKHALMWNVHVNKIKAKDLRMRQYVNHNHINHNEANPVPTRAERCLCSKMQMDTSIHQYIHTSRS